jgi:diguanylate cyclase (GGDEF)-like protein
VDQVIEANDGIGGLKLLLSVKPDLVLCDLEMPGLDGEKILRMSQQAGAKGEAVPFIVLTAVSDPIRRARLLEEGASDTITKPFHTVDLIARVGLHLKLLRAQRELTRKNQELQRLSRTDPLTGLPNRRELDRVLEAEFNRSKRYGIPFSIAMGDVDSFKVVNDERRHPVGDLVLQRVADAMRDIVRETDCGGHFGGEEFLAVLGSNGDEGARVFAERWRRRVEDIKLELDTGETVSVTISIGVASWNPDIESAEQMIQSADAALYRAKAAGRNRVCI